MNNNFCHRCYEKLEVRLATPCQICGHDENKIEEFLQKEQYRIYALADNTEITLCYICYLEEGLSNPGFILEALKIRPEEAKEKIRFFDYPKSVAISKDKYCNHCAMRFSLLKIIEQQKAKGTQ